MIISAGNAVFPDKTEITLRIRVSIHIAIIYEPEMLSVNAL